jgi:hypothetical protein
VCRYTSLRPSHNESVTDQLSFALWLNRSNRPTRVRHFEQLLKLFPFSQREQPASTISIQAIDSTQPPLLEQAIDGPLDPEALAPIFRDYEADDIACRVESWWDLWQFDHGDAKLAPARVALSCLGPEFDGGTQPGQEDLRIDFGVDSNFLPQAEIPGSTRFIESNIKSLLRLVHEIESTLPAARRKLETESGENFADRLQQVLQANA